MRILYWTELFWPYIGGIQVLAGHTLRALRQRGHEIEVVTCHKRRAWPDTDEYAGIPVHRFAVREALARHDIDSLAEMSAAVARLKNRFQPDIVHMNFAGPSMWLYFRTAAAHPTPLVMAFRGFHEGARGPDTLLAHAADSVTWAVAVSRAVLGSVLEIAPQLRLRSSVIYNSAPEPAIAVSPLPIVEPRLLCLGRLVEEKRFHVAIGAMTGVRARFPQAQLLIAGDGPERTNLERLVSELGLDAATRFLGWVAPEVVPDLLNQTTLLLMPSRTEGCPNVAIQAGQMCRPVVGMRVGGLPEVVQHDETGVLVEEQSSVAFGEAICALLSRPERARRMGEAARAYVRRCFDWQEHVGAYETLYGRLV